MFTTCLKDIFRRLNWEEKGIKVYGEYLSNLKFSDDLFQFANNFDTCHEMIEELQKEGIKADFNINIAETTIMVNESISDTWKIAINDKEVEKKPIALSI